MPVRFEIHPAIGFARVGTSDKHFVFDGAASANQPRRDIAGMLRQAAEFRVYRCERDAAGKLLQAEEMTPDKASIRWSVHVANRKAVAKRFTRPGRRNTATGNDANDAALIIDSGLQVVGNPGESKLLGGKFQGLGVNLGKITVGNNGRLLFIGSDGQAKSPKGKPIVDFADNDGWFDAMGDGPVRATVTRLDGSATEALAAWVVISPPDYAPGLVNIVTMFDVLVDLAIRRNLLPAPQPIVFTRHIRPILERAMSYQWVNAVARLGYPQNPSGGHATDGPGDFNLEMSKLADPAAPNARRQKIFNLLRAPNTQSHGPNRKGMPRLNDDENSADVFPLPPAMYEAMRLWSEGHFVTDAPAELELEPEALTRVALEACVGGPFFPGIEAGSIMRDAARYMPNEAFRLSPDRIKPGGITENNAVPWQADFHQCRWEEGPNASPKRLAWWPAQRPDDVLKKPNEDPIPWARGIPDSGEGMVEHWHQLGFVKEVPVGSGVFLEQERDGNLPDIGVV